MHTYRTHGVPSLPGCGSAVSAAAATLLENQTTLRLSPSSLPLPTVPGPYPHLPSIFTWLLQRGQRGGRHVVEEAEAHGPLALGVVAGGAHHRQAASHGAAAHSQRALVWPRGEGGISAIGSRRSLQHMFRLHGNGSRDKQAATCGTAAHRQRGLCAGEEGAACEVWGVGRTRAQCWEYASW